MTTKQSNALQQTIYGTIPSKSNSYKIAGKMLIKTERVKEYESSFYIQCNHYRNRNIAGYFELHVKVFYPNGRSDLDGAMKAILDCLQHCKAIKNDNKCCKIVAEKFLDKNSPRIEFSLIEI